MSLNCKGYDSSPPLQKGTSLPIDPRVKTYRSTNNNSEAHIFERIPEGIAEEIPLVSADEVKVRKDNREIFLKIVDLLKSKPNGLTHKEIVDNLPEQFKGLKKPLNSLWSILYKYGEGIEYSDDRPAKIRLKDISSPMK